MLHLLAKYYLLPDQGSVKYIIIPQNHLDKSLLY